MRNSWKRGSRCQSEDQASLALTSGSVSETGPPGLASSSCLTVMTGQKRSKPAENSPAWTSTPAASETSAVISSL